MKQKVKEVEKMIDSQLKESNGWWKSEGKKSLLKYSKQLLEKGFTIDETFDIVSGIFLTACAEYGD